MREPRSARKRRSVLLLISVCESAAPLLRYSICRYAASRSWRRSASQIPAKPRRRPSGSAAQDGRSTPKEKQLSEQRKYRKWSAAKQKLEPVLAAIPQPKLWSRSEADLGER